MAPAAIRAPSSAATRGSDSSSPRAVGHGVCGSPVGAAPALTPGSVGSGVRALGQLGQRGGGISGQGQSHHRVGVLPGRLRVERHLHRVASAGQPGAQRLGGGQVAHAQDQVGAVRGRERFVAQQRVVVGDGRRAAPCAGQRVGQHRVTRWSRPGRPPRRPGRRTPRPDRTPARREGGCPPVQTGARSRRAGDRGGRPLGARRGRHPRGRCRRQAGASGGTSGSRSAKFR